MPANDSPKQTPKTSVTNSEGVRAWLVSAVAEEAGLDPLTLDPERPIAEFGLGSRQLVTVAAELSTLIGRSLEPSLVFNHPTIAALAEAVLDDGLAVATAADATSASTAARADDDIAIISLACRFPGGADDPEALWRLLVAGEDAITEVPAGRWDTQGLYDPDPEATGKAYTLRGGFLSDIDRFDAPFFGISPREAAAMDPQQRLLLQTTWETIERAGIVPQTLNGSSTGVYLGLYDSGYLASAGLGQLDGHVGTGSASSVASGRIAYTLGLQGPAVTVDTACSSSLVALHLAARALASGECDLALAGGATLLVTPRGHVEFSRLRGLSPSGRCSPFSTDADGVVWAEGCGLVLLKRLADARRDGDRVLAVVKGSAINQDGRSQGLSAPNGPAQERVLRAALDAAGLRPDDLDYVEAHGTGTRLGDPIEGRALAAVFGPGRPAGRPLGVGSLKSNIGHTQAAAGIGGVIKTVLAFGHELLPASLHAENPTEHVDWPDSGLRVHSSAQVWPRGGDRVRRAGVSAFGISGTNAHVVLEEAPEDLARPAAERRPAQRLTAGQPPAGPRRVEAPAAPPRRVEERTAEPDPGEQLPVEPRPAEEQTRRPKAAERPSVEEQLAESRPVGEQLAESKPAEDHSAEAEHFDPLPVEPSQVAAPRHVEEQSAEAKHSEQLSAEPSQAEAQVPEPRHVEEQAAGGKCSEQLPAERSRVKGQASESKPAEDHSAEAEHSDPLLVEPSQAEAQVAEPRHVEEQMAAGNRSEQLPAERSRVKGQVAEPRPAEDDSAEGRRSGQPAEPSRADEQTIEPELSEPSPLEEPTVELPAKILFPLSARTLPALQGQAARLAEALAAQPQLPLSGAAATLTHHRTHFEHRAVVQAAHRDELLTALHGLAEGQPDADLTVGPQQALPAAKLAFVFPGQGSQWAGMARDLLDGSPVFVDELDRCDAALRPFTTWSVAAVLRGDAGAPPLDRVDVVQPVLFAVMVSLAAVWRARGVRPDAVIGHSQGEVAAACVAGALSLNDAAAVVALRSQALTELSGSGTMAVVALPHTEVEARLAEFDGRVSVAAVNSGRSTVIAGEVEPLEALLADFDRAQVFARRLDVDYASHSAQVEPVRATILDELDGVITYPTSVAWYSTVTGEPVTEELEADYWYTNLREPVRFGPTVERMAADGYRHFVELGPHPSLLTALRTVAEDAGHDDLVAVGSLRRDEDGPVCLDRAAAELHVHGRHIDWRRVVADAEPADLPTYAWDPQRYWIEPESAAGAPGLFDRAAHPLLGIQLQSADETRWTFRNEWSTATADWLPDHTVFGRTVVSGTTLMELCRAALAVARPDDPGDVTDLFLLAPLTLPESGTAEVSVEVSTAGPVPEITVHSRPRGQEAMGWTLHATASAAEPAPVTAGQPPVWPQAAEPAWSEETYERLTGLGLGYGPAFQGVRSAVATGDGELLARLSLPSVVRDAADPYPVHPALLDAALHVTAAFDASEGRVLLPVAVGRCVLPLGGASELTARVRRSGGSGTDLTLDVTLWDADGLPAGRLEGVRLRAVDPADLNGGSESGRHLYEVVWTAAPEEPTGTPGTDWAVVGDRSDPEVVAALRGLEASGIEVRETGADVLVRFWPRPGTDAEPAVAAQELAATALAELQALIALPEGEAPTRTVWVTRGAVAAGDGDTVPGLAQSVLWGLARSARTEHPDLGLTLLDLDGADPVGVALPATAAHTDEPELAFRAGALLVPRLVRARAPETLRIPAGDHYELAGLPADPTLRAVASQASLAPGQVRIQVHAFAVHPNSARLPGDETLCAGVLTEVGADVEEFAPGLRVVALADSAPGSEAVADARLVAVLPDDLPFTGAAVLPLALTETVDREQLGAALREAVTARQPRPAHTRVLPVTAAREAIRRGIASGGPVVLDLVGRPTLVPADGTVLISGGLGAVGRHIARLLAEHGVPRLLLTSRQGPDDPRAAEVTVELTALGAEVEVAACDIADAAAVADVLGRIGDELPLRGVVHCAGILADGVVAELTPERLAQVLRPKVDGAAHLHRLTADAPLDLFLLVSSAAGVVGNAGQSNYAAANVFLDQLAHHRRSLGLPGVSVSFGAWAGEGLAAEHADLERMARLGHRALTPDQGRDLVELSLRRGAPHLVAWALDLPRLRDNSTTVGGTSASLWRSLLPAPRTGRDGGDGLADRLARLPEAERAERVLALVREEASRALCLRSAESVRPDQPLRELGMDSVTAVDLRNRIGTRIGAKLPATLLFDHPTPARLAEYLLTTALATGSRTTRRTAPDTQPARTTASASDEPVALVAMACRLPGGVSDPDGLWRLVAEGRDAVGPFPAGRWDVESLYDPDPEALGKSYAREGGFLEDLESFDAGFFGITPKEAAAMDPQQRLLLETAWEALERAGIVPAALAGSTTGVYVGMFGSDYLSGSRLDQLDGYVGTGSALSVASGRLAYVLGLGGPALTVDTACSSSLVALHLAAQALRSGECDLALAGGVTLMVTPQTFVEFSRLRGLSPTGRCRSFSDGADGAIWAEGAGMVVLKRLSDARRDGDEVLAVLRGTAVNQDGRSQGLSAPNGPAQEQVIRRALELSGLGPADIDYVEAHGTGTTLGDPIEANALSEVFGDSRPPGRPLYLGSLKSNIGHAQAASGVLGLMKVVQSLRQETLPRTLHADTPSRHVDWDGSGLQLLQEAVDWPSSQERVRRAGVSAFGISGTNAHLIVEEAPPVEAEPTGELPPGKRLFVLSGRSESAVRGQAARLAEHLRDDTVALPDIAHTLARHRSHFERRATIVAGDANELRTVLDALATGRKPLAPPREEQTGKVAFVFAGHGGQWPGMGLESMADSEAFRDELARVDEAVRRHVGWSVLNVLRAPEEFSPLDRTEYLQPVLFAVNAALAAAWRALGVTPDAVVGHSLGEIAAAYSVGALTLDEAVTVVSGRAQAVVPLVGHGGMQAVELPRAEVEKLLAPYADRLFVAAVNSQNSTAVSGETDALAELRQHLEERAIPVRRLSTAFASHTPLMDPLREELLDRFSGVRGTRTPTPLYSAVLAEPVPGDRLDAEYWFANLRQPVRFADAIRRMLDDGYRYFVELSPHPSLIPSIEAVAAEAGIDAVGVGSLRRQQDGRDVLLRRLGELYEAGHTPDWPVVFREGRRIDLPTYAFARERHWLAPAPAAASGASPLLGTHIEASDEPERHIFQSDIDLRDSRFGYLTDHRVTGEVWLPGAAFLGMALEGASALHGGGEVRLADVRFIQPLRLDTDRPVRLQLVLRPAEDGFRDFTIASAAAGERGTRWERHAVGQVAVGAMEPVADARFAALREHCTQEVDLSGVYGRLATLGIDYGPAFRGLEAGRRADSAALGRLADKPAAGHLLHPAVLDAAFHVAALPGNAPEGRAFVPAGVGRLRFTGLRTTPTWVTCALRSVDGDTATLDLRLWDENEQLVLEAEEFELAALSPLDGALFETSWQPRPDAHERPAEGSWLILADETGVAAELAERLGSSVPHVIARRGQEFGLEAPGRYILDPTDPQHLARLFDEAFTDGPPERVVQLSSLDAPEIGDARTAEEAARLCCLSTLHLVRTLADRPQGRAPRLFVVARGSQAAGDSTQVTHPQQALAWGFGLAVAQEYPELSTTLIDLPGTDGTDALWTQLRHADDERLVALRESGRLVPRLARTRPDDGGHAEVTPDGVHLITGGLGGLGRVVAERLVRGGARRLALMSRGTPDADTAGWIKGLQERGVTVHLARADVADRDGLSAALEAVRREAGPIAAVVHAAGVLDDATVANLTDERVLRVLAPKVLGTALLTELIPEAGNLVLFASAAGLLGSAGQSPYSAANAFLDAWAHHLARTDRRALSLDWGTWEGVGMVTESGARAAEAGRSGLVAFSPQDGGELFDRVLATSRRQLAPIALDWEMLALDPDAARTRPILGDLVTVPVGTADSDGLVKKVFAATTNQDRAEWLEAYVRARVGEVSGGVVDVFATSALKELGLDSLMLVRLRNAFARELGVELPAAAVFSASDVRSLARTLGEALPERNTAAHEEDPQAEAAVEVPESELRPATRDVVRLLRSAQPGMPDAAHGVGLAVRLATPTTRETLTDIVTRLAGRHAALRTAVVNSAEGGRQLRVVRDVAQPVLSWTTAEGELDAVDGLRRLLEPPFDLANPSLWRFELLDGGVRGQVLVFGAHHAVSDLQSLLLVAGEIDAELSGTSLGDAVTNRDIHLLIEAQQSGDAPGAGAAEWREAFHGSARLDLTLARPRPAARSYRAGSVTVAIPDGLMERVSAAASGLAITPAAFCLGTLTVLLARKRERERFVLAVPVDTRIHADAYDAVGFFGVPVPFPAEARPGERIEEVLRRTDRRLDRVLAKGAMFSDVLSTLAQQGLYRANAPLVEVYFNYVRSSAGRLTNLEVLPAGTGYTDLDLMITMTPDAGRVRLDHNLDILDAATSTGLGEEFVRLLAEAVEVPAAQVRTAVEDPMAAVRTVVEDPMAAVGTTLEVAPVVAETRAMAGATAAEEPAASPRPSLALAATFALGDLPLLCQAAANEGTRDGGPTVAEAPYHQVLAGLRDPSGVFADPTTAVGVVLLRAVDLERFGPVDDALLAELRTEYPAALRALSERTRKPLIVGFLPSVREEERLARWEREMAAELAELPGIAVLRPDDWTRHHAVEEPFDERTERLAHLPFTPRFQAAVALRLAEVVRAVRRPAPKVIAVDGDETLWGGVAGEIGTEAVDLAGPRALLARRLLQWRAAGALLALVSNNDEDTVRAVLERPDSLLKAEHFSVLSATWGPKSGRLAETARTLNLGLDSFLFLDDNPVEIGGVRSALPQVLSVTCPPAPELEDFLGRLWPLVPAAATAEDALRAEFYEQERERDAVREQAGFEEFLAQLELEVDIRALSEADVQRADQLVRRTNQFTLRARSADGGDLARWRENGEVWTVAARDRFGDYGQIGLLAVRPDGDQLDVLAWLMSCRALGRGVEERLLQWLAVRADELGCAKVRLTAERTPRNVPARRLLAALGGGDQDDERLESVATPEHLRAFRSWQRR
ncbi:SDR family NAD(P)-dependent oxidoreductase [Streptomyces sp. R41]|uniref:SDR family NAD(P)-dependent oxidoreductase n=1 Tax=Streptomyces sp. R41 TaxID=3238632 RepID=A0AB39R9D1_9ACTN